MTAPATSGPRVAGGDGAAGTAFASMRGVLNSSLDADTRLQSRLDESRVAERGQIGATMETPGRADALPRETAEGSGRTGTPPNSPPRGHCPRAVPRVPLRPRARAALRRREEPTADQLRWTRSDSAPRRPRTARQRRCLRETRIEPGTNGKVTSAANDGPAGPPPAPLAQHDGHCPIQIPTLRAARGRGQQAGRDRDRCHRRPTVLAVPRRGACLSALGAGASPTTRRTDHEARRCRFRRPSVASPHVRPQRVNRNGSLRCGVRSDRPDAGRDTHQRIRALQPAADVDEFRPGRLGGLRARDDDGTRRMACDRRPRWSCLRRTWARYASNCR
jgi:hypothetical protein